MFKSIIVWLKTKEYTLTENELFEIYKQVDISIREETDQEYKYKINDFEKTIQDKNNYISKLENDYSSLIIKTDILQAKLNKKEPTIDKTLASEIFKEEE